MQRFSTVFLALALAATPATAGEPMTENSHPLVLVLHTSHALPEIRVTASVHNPTSKRIYLQIKTPEVYVVSATLVDDADQPVEGMHDWANKGAAITDHRFEGIQPGAALALDTFALDDAHSDARGGGMTWDLREQRGRTVVLTYTFRASCDEPGSC